MISTRTFVASMAFLGLALIKGAQPVQAVEGNALSVTPIKGISLVLGTKRAIGYYIADNGACNLTLMLQEISFVEENFKPNAARVNMTVGAGTSSSLDTADGPTLAFKCQPSAASMKIEVIDRVAYETARK